MKRSHIILIGIMTLMCGCTESSKSKSNSYSEQCKKVIGESDKWKVVQINDSIVVCLPGLNADRSLNPVVININNVK